MEKSVKIIRYLILGGISLVPLLVLIVTESLFFPFITGKNFSLRILTEIIFSLWLILMLFDKRYRPRKSGILIAVSLFTFILILSTIFGVNPSRSFWSNYERMEGLLAYLHLFALFMVLTSVMKTEKLWKYFFHLSLGVSVIVALYGLLQMAGKLAIHQSGSRLDATLGNASYLAIYMAFHIFLSLLYFFRTQEWYRWFYLPPAFLQGTILYNTETRGAILGLVGGLILTSILIVFFSKSKKIRMVSALVLLLIFILVGLFWFFKSSDFIQKRPALSRIANISITETTTQSRLVIWKLSWEGFKEKPLLGWGPENYNLVFNKYYQPILWRQEPWFDRAHNVFLDRLTTNGILGLMAYLALFATGLYYLWLKRKKLGFSVYDSAILTSMFAAYFFHNLFVFDNIVSSILFFSFLAYISSKNQPQEETEKIKINPSKYWQKSAYAIIVGVMAIFAIYFINIPAILAGHDLIKAFEFSAKGDLNTAFQKFEKSISRNSLGTTEAREHLASFATKIISGPNIDNDFKTKVFQFAAGEMDKQIKQSPTDIRYMIFLANLYNTAGQHDGAIDILNKAIGFSPRKQQLYFELGTAYLNKREYDKALEVLKKAFDLEPGYLDARKIYAVSAIFKGDDNLAEELMKDYGGLIIMDQRFVSAFAARKRYDKVAEIWQKFIEQEPKSIQYRVSLAAAYVEMGEKEKAIKELEKAIEIEPKYKSQLEFYINELKSGRNP